MKNPAYEQIQARKVKARLRMLQHAQRISGNVSQTCRFFGVSRALFYIWKERHERHGVAGLRDLPRRPHNIRFRIPPEIVSLILRIREERRYGAVRVSLYLQRHYHAYVSPTTILKIFHRHHVGPVSQKKYRPGPKPPDAPLQVPGRSVQLDVKFVPRVGRARQRFYQFTAIDEATRFRVLRIYDHDNTKIVGMYCIFPSPIQGLSRGEARIFEPALIEEISGPIRSSRPYQPRNGVNHEAHVFRLFTLTGAMA